MAEKGSQALLVLGVADTVLLGVIVYLLIRQNPASYAPLYVPSCGEV